MEQASKSADIPVQIVDIWQHIVDVISDLMSVPSVMINRLEPPDLEVFRSNGDPSNPFPTGTRMELAGVYCAVVAQKRQMLQVDNARKDRDWSESPTAKAGIFAYLGIPLCWPSGEVFGTLCAVDVKENKWGEAYANLIRTFKGAIEVHLAHIVAMESLDKKNKELERAMSEVKDLRGLLPICASCKNIRDDKGYWNQIENYLSEHSEITFTHGICPVCIKRLYPGLCDDE